MTYNTTTTLNRIREASPRTELWTKLLSHLGKTQADDEPLELLTVLDSNGLGDALWVLSRAMPDDRLARHFQAWCAEQVLHLFEAERPSDMRVRDQISMLRNDDVTDKERDVVRRSARDAAWVAMSTAANLSAQAASWHDVDDASKNSARAEWIFEDDDAYDRAISAQEAQLRKMLKGET
jgi:hypothetical protein